MKPIYSILLVGLGAMLCQAGHAALIRSSQFVGYSTGRLGADSATGTLDGWQNPTPNFDVTVTNGSGSLDGTSLGLVASAGDRVFISANSVLNTRNQFVPNSTFPQSVETNIYYSFLYKFNDASVVPTGGLLLFRVNRANSGTGTAQHWDMLAKNVAGQIQLGIAKAGAPSNATNYATTNISSGQTIFVVVRQHILTGAQNDVYDLWINPPPESFGTNEANIPPSSASVGALTTDGTEDSSSTGPGRFVVVSGSNAQFDEFRVATTWAEATPWFGQCVSAGVAFSPTNLTQSAEISATFRVVELGTSPTILWQRSTDGGTTWNNIGGATAATYVTPNLALSDSGNKYRAIVTVPCNSSTATSAVATVTLTAPVSTAVGLICHDLFDDSLRDDPPVGISNSVWRTAVSAALDAFTTPGIMVGTPQPGSSVLWLGYFTDDTTTNLPVHLAVGRSLRVTLPFTPESYASFTNNGTFRIGLYDYADGGIRLTNDSSAAGGSAGNGTGVRGYMLNMAFGTNFVDDEPLQLLARSFLPDNNLMGTVADYQDLGSGPAGGGYSNAPAFQPGTNYTLVFTVARTDVNSANVTASITGGGTNWTWSATDTNFAYHRFDSIGIRPNSVETTADKFDFPEVKVEVVQGLASVPPFNITAFQLLTPPGAVKLTWNSVSGATYHVLQSATLWPPNWATNGTVVATGSSTSFTNPVPTGNVYYRVLAPPYTP